MDIDTNDILKILEQLGQQLTPAGKYVFELAVRQQVIEGIVGGSLLVLGFIISVSLLIFGWKSANRAEKNHENTDFEIGIFLGGGFIFIITCIEFLGGVVNLATKIFNPEYAALRDLMATLMGNK